MNFDTYISVQFNNVPNTCLPKKIVRLIRAGVKKNHLFLNPSKACTKLSAKPWKLESNSDVKLAAVDLAEPRFSFSFALASHFTKKGYIGFSAFSPYRV